MADPLDLHLERKNMTSLVTDFLDTYKDDLDFQIRTKKQEEPSKPKRRKLTDYFGSSS
jgi:hypothetical protein